MTDPIAELRGALGDRFAIERLLGQGGMGAVYLARDRQLDRPVALKVLPAEFAAQHDLRERFLRETRTTAGFSHPNIVPVFSVEERPGLLAYAMGFIEGESVAELVGRTGPMSVRDAVRMLQDIAYALAYAHGRGVIHRDIKPDNIMIERATGRALLMDFGISRAVQAAPAPGSTRAGLTRVGEVVGTPEYMSPEQASGDVLDGRSDLYSLGLVAWFALTGATAMAGDSTQKVLVKQLTERVPPVASKRSDVPPLLASVVERCLQKTPDDRFANAEGLVDALDTEALRGVDIPLPVRLFAGELTQVTLLLIGAACFAPILLSLVREMYEGANLDIILPMVMFAAIVWGRAAQTVHQARMLAGRGFGVAALMRGFAQLRAEQDAERQQLRSNPAIVAKRRKQVIILSIMFVMTFVMREIVLRTMRTETKPDWYVISNAGAVILYSAYTMRGLAVVGLLRSPLRANLGERLWHLFWGGAPGRALLTLFTLRAAAPIASTTLPPTGAITAPARSARTPGPLPAVASTNGDRRTLEARVEALEAWRKEISDV